MPAGKLRVMGVYKVQLTPDVNGTFRVRVFIGDTVWYDRGGMSETAANNTYEARIQEYSPKR